MKSDWLNLPTKSVRVPESFVSKILKLARLMDNDEPLEEFVELLLSSGHFVDYSFAVSSDNELSFHSMPRNIGIEGLYYITHFDNIPSILDKGILSHNLVDKKGLRIETIYNEEVNRIRADKAVCEGKKLWDFANLYFQPRNAMLYSLVNRKSLSEKLAILCIKKKILNRPGVFVTDGNAASSASRMYSYSQCKNSSLLSQISSQVNCVWWKKEDGSKRKIMAECLVPDKVPPSYIHSIYVSSLDLRSNLRSSLHQFDKIQSNKIPVVVDPERFFCPDFTIKIGRNITLVKGDMFFSRAQTLTISVNCIGAMGKGLASTAKYRFPDVYVQYQDICKAKKIKLGFPYLCKRESSVFSELYDEYLPNDTSSTSTWFLLFPTKDHWRNDSKIESIEQGLIWLLDNYQRLGITSLALPSLGCGLGKLHWSEVGPLMCRYLSNMSINVFLYLPTEREIDSHFLSEEYLLAPAF